MPSQWDEARHCQLTEVRLERFKAAFKPPTVALRQFNVVIGRNGSGKSTLLEALQWVDTTIRKDTRLASDRYFGMHDLVNLRSRTAVPYFEIQLAWRSEGLLDGLSAEEPGLKVDGAPTFTHLIRIAERKGIPHVDKDDLRITIGDQRFGPFGRAIPGAEPGASTRGNGGGSRPFVEPDRLTFGRMRGDPDTIDGRLLNTLVSFWSRAVFLRLSPNRLTRGSAMTRASYEPMLDEEGQTLPALLAELDDEQRAGLVEDISAMLPDIKNVSVIESGFGSDKQVNYTLSERMPYVGRSGKSTFPIPSWMLSEGTRRITAILALLRRSPPPSLLCIEEIENGLDPWTVVAVLHQLQSSADAGTQIIVTTHSPWLLDHVDMGDIIQVRRIEGDTRYEHFASRKEVQEFKEAVPAGTRYVASEET